MSDFTDGNAATAVLAGILRHGRDAFVDADEFLGTSSLDDETDQVIYACCKGFYDGGADRPLDYPTLLSTAQRLGLSSSLRGEDAKRRIASLLKTPVELETVRYEAGKLLKLEIARHLDEIAAQARRDLRKLSGTEALGSILATLENPLFDYTAKLQSEGHDTHQIGDGIDEWLDNIIANPRDTIGIPTPFPKYNALIGGGFRRKGVSIMGARPKSGKTVCVDNICLHVAGHLGIPVFNLDTEMTSEEHWARILAHLTGIPINLIEMGKFSRDQADQLRESAAWLKSIPYYYRSVIDETFEEQVAAMRRWIVKTVGTDADGVRKDCLIAYDYLQLTDPGEFSSNNFKEYQLLGFQMVALTRMAKKYDVPILSMLQLNRDGIDKETTAVAAGSDRIIWKCANFSILKRKEIEEIEADGAEEGNLKLINLIARHGPGGEPGDYIHLKFDGATARLTEGKARRELDRLKKPSTSRKFESEDDDPIALS